MDHRHKIKCKTIKLTDDNIEILGDLEFDNNVLDTIIPKTQSMKEKY